MDKKSLYFLIFFLFLLYLPSFSNFFSGDDWFHLRISNIHGLDEFFNFFAFNKTEQSASFYRPLSTQVFFFLFYKIWGLNVLPYHLFSFAVFIGILILFYLILKKLFNKDLAFLSVVIYGISATNFTRIYFLSSFQEILMTFLLLLSFWFYIYKKNLILVVSFFGLALLSKETAVVYPIFLWLYTFYKQKEKINKVLISSFVLLFFYLILRIFSFGIAEGDSYVWDFSIKKMINTASWYFLWSLGAPEYLVDYIGSGFRILPRFYEVTGWLSYPLLFMIAGTLGLIFFVFYSYKEKKKLLFPSIIFILGILPVLFLPWHKFTLELSLSLLGFSLGLSLLITENKKKLISLFLLMFFVTLNFLSYYLTLNSHYSITRGEVSKSIVNYFKENYHAITDDYYIEFSNGIEKTSPEWGVSKQIAQITSRSDMFSVIYGKKIDVFFEDIEGERPRYKKRIEVDSLQFLK